MTMNLPSTESQLHAISQLSAHTISAQGFPYLEWNMTAPFPNFGHSDPAPAPRSKTRRDSLMQRPECRRLPLLETVRHILCHQGSSHPFRANTNETHRHSVPVALSPCKKHIPSGMRAEGGRRRQTLVVTRSSRCLRR